MCTACIFWGSVEAFHGRNVLDAVGLIVRLNALMVTLGASDVLL